jgi:dienelactone hydrolase
MQKSLRQFVVGLVLFGSCTSFALAQSTKPDTSRGDRMIANYFRSECERIAANGLITARSASDWKRNLPELRRQLFDMFGLDPLPARGDLKAVVTGTLERDGIVVENLHFQSSPGLYVTANLYRPKDATKPLPTVLYLCGHGAVKKDNVSFGNKCTYTHHGSWFAKNGYVCLAIDTLQLGEIEGIHHGTRRFDRWWWMSRGYTPAGVEAWNCIRALDYLETRPEVDRDRIGATGRSGGGAYSWSILGLDDRIKAAVPVAGIVDLESYVVDGAIEGHCDCMFFNNTYEWDYPQLAALAAPRPVLLANTDKDHIFPLAGVLRVHEHMRRVYGFTKAGDKQLGLQISEGPHKDIPELQLAAFRWLNRFLKSEDPPIEMPAAKMFTPEELRVFKELPKDEINTRIDETFVAKAKEPKPPKSLDEWKVLRDGWMKGLREMCFRAWPDGADQSRLTPLALSEVSNSAAHGVRMRTFDFVSQANVKLRFWLLEKEDAVQPRSVTLTVFDQDQWPRFATTLKWAFPREFSQELATEKSIDGAASWRGLRILLDKAGAIAVFAPRGVGPTAWSVTGRKGVETRRRFLLMGQTLDGMQTFDIRRACQALRSVNGFQDMPLQLDATGPMAGNALCASLFEPNITRLDLHDLPSSHNAGPYFLNVLRVLDMPQSLAMVAERTEVHLFNDDTKNDVEAFARDVQQQLGWPAGQLQIHAAGK